MGYAGGKAQEPWVRAIPHITDGLLLLSAIGMLLTANGLAWPDWLQVKLALLVVYVILVTVVFRWGKNRLQKGLAWVVGLALYLFVTSVAVLQHPRGALSLL